MALVTVPPQFLVNVSNADGIGGVDVVDAFDRWALARGMRGKDIFDTIAKVMRYWVSFAMAKIPLGDRAKVRAGLMKQIRNYSALDRVVYAGGRNRDTRRANLLRGTVASAIVAIINWNGARELARARSPQYYVEVSRFIGSREYSVNHHRAGMIPALNVLGRGQGLAASERGGVKPPKYAHPPGSIEHGFTDELAEILVENFASQSGNHPFRTRPDTIAGLAGEAFDTALAEVVGMIGEFLYHDLGNAAAAAGFSVNGRHGMTAATNIIPLPSMALAA